VWEVVSMQWEEVAVRWRNWGRQWQEEKGKERKERAGPTTTVGD
jgi:hypothetical protein